MNPAYCVDCGTKRDASFIEPDGKCIAVHCLPCGTSLPCCPECGITGIRSAVNQLDLECPSCEVTFPKPKIKDDEWGITSKERQFLLTVGGRLSQHIGKLRSFDHYEEHLAREILDTRYIGDELKRFIVIPRLLEWRRRVFSAEAVPGKADPPTTDYLENKLLTKNSSGRDRLLAYYNSITNLPSKPSDDNGHGSHLAGITVNSSYAKSSKSSKDKSGKSSKAKSSKSTKAKSSKSTKAESGKFKSIAPDADLVVVKAFDELGTSTYADIVRGLHWVLVHKDEYNIRVLNMSFSSEPVSAYWDDPVNQAVMRLWQAGILIVASAGNKGQAPMIFCQRIPLILVRKVCPYLDSRHSKGPQPPCLPYDLKLLFVRCSFLYTLLGC